MIVGLFIEICGALNDARMIPNFSGCFFLDTHGDSCLYGNGLLIGGRVRVFRFTGFG